MKKLECIIIVLSLSLCSIFTRENIFGVNNQSPFTIYYLDVGDADCAIVECDGEYTMIDCGSETIDDNFGYYKLELFLKELGITEFKYVFCTHPDEDHFEGFSEVLSNIKCKTIYCSGYEKDTASVIEFNREIKGMNKIVPTVGQTLKLGVATIEILAVDSYKKSSNDSSIVLMITYVKNKFLFTGDAENQTENTLLNHQMSKLDCDVLKVAHHGRKTSSKPEFLSAASPKYMVISASQETPTSVSIYDYIDRHNDVSLYYTWEHGTMICKSDGYDITFEDRNGNKLNSY